MLLWLGSLGNNPVLTGGESWEIQAERHPQQEQNHYHTVSISPTEENSAIIFLSPLEPFMAVVGLIIA
jgi:hypothetical protein